MSSYSFVNVKIIGGSTRNAPPLSAQFFFNFQLVFGKMAKIMLPLPAPRLGNPGSTTDFKCKCFAYNVCLYGWQWYAPIIGGSRGGREGRTPPPGVQILSISCSFRENLACSRPPWRVHAPPRENPGSATANKLVRFNTHSILISHLVSCEKVFNTERWFLRIKTQMSALYFISLASA